MNIYYSCNEMPEFNNIGFNLNSEMKIQLEIERNKIRALEDTLSMLQILRGGFFRAGVLVSSVPVVMNTSKNIGPSIGMSDKGIEIFALSTSMFVVFKILSTIMKESGDGLLKEREEIIRRKVRRNISMLANEWREKELIGKDETVFFERMGEKNERTLIQKALIGIKFIARTVYIPEDKVGRNE